MVKTVIKLVNLLLWLHR